MGKSVDLDQEFAEQLNNLSAQLGQLTGTVDKFNIQAMASAWMVFEVTESNATDYVLSGKLAIKLAADANFAATGEMPKAGTYPILDSVPMEQMTVSVDLKEDFAAVLQTLTSFEKDTMAVKTIEVEFKTSALVNLQARNIPSRNYTFTHKTISYQDISFDLNFDLDIKLKVEFDPYLNIIEFPLNVSETWQIHSDATMSGSLSGNLDMKGLPEEQEQQMFDNEMLKAASITSFPVDLSGLSNSESPKITNGVLEPYATPVQATMYCVSSELIQTPVHGAVAVYEIQVNNGPERLYYSDDVKFLTSMGANTDSYDLPLPPEMDGLQGLLLSKDVQMQEVEPATANSEIQNISDYQADIVGTSSSSTAITDLFTKSPYIGMIVVAAVLVCVVSALLTIRRKK